MRFLFLLFSACIVTALHAVTVTWTVPNSQYKWLSRTASDTPGTPLIDTAKVGIYFVYTSTQLTADTVGSIAPTTAGTKPALPGVTMSDTAAFANAANDDEKIGARATFKNLSGDAAASGYYYMVVFSKENKNENLYMVAGGSKYIAKQDESTGIYDSTVSGKDPTGADYVDVSIVGGTWTAAKTPEPTTFALLALGMAGLALRRRVQR